MRHEGGLVIDHAGNGRFQSAPDLSIGGDRLAGLVVDGDVEFQSAPDLSIGGDVLSHYRARRLVEVSISPRPFDRG